MRLYKFVRVRGMGAVLTTDKTGANLPKGRWGFQKEIDVEATDGPRIGLSSAEIIAAVKKDGYCLWPVPASGNG